MKAKVLVFYCNDGAAAKAAVMSLRSDETGAFARDATLFDENEECDRVVICPDVPGWMAKRIGECFPGKVAERPVQIDSDEAPRRRGRPRRAA